jgi:hypothetical protein
MIGSVATATLLGGQGHRLGFRMRA